MIYPVDMNESILYHPRLISTADDHMPQTRTLLVDDHLLARAGIRALLESLPGYSVIGECADGIEAVSMAKTLSPDLILLDLMMPGLSGIEVARHIRSFNHDTKILMLSVVDRQESAEKALDAGVNGYLAKDFIFQELADALASVRERGHYISPRLQPSPAGSDGADKPTAPALTARQLEILKRVASGMTTKTIARDLGISPKTVEFHRSQLMQRVGLRDVAGLTRYALQHALLD